MYIKKKTESKPTYEQLKKRYAELTAGKRQHGKLPTPLADPVAEYKRLYKVVKSLEYRARMAEKAKEEDAKFEKEFSLHRTKSDDNGIKPVDERRYNNCFHSTPHGQKVYRSYIKRMTGMTLKQIYILQEKTGLIPYPKISKEEADKDQRYRDYNGIYI